MNIPKIRGIDRSAGTFVGASQTIFLDFDPLLRISPRVRANLKMNIRCPGARCAPDAAPKDLGFLGGPGDHRRRVGVRGDRPVIKLSCFCHAISLASPVAARFGENSVFVQGISCRNPEMCDISHIQAQIGAATLWHHDRL